MAPQPHTAPSSSGCAPPEPLPPWADAVHVPHRGPLDVAEARTITA